MQGSGQKSERWRGGFFYCEKWASTAEHWPEDQYHCLDILELICLLFPSLRPITHVRPLPALTTVKSVTSAWTSLLCIHRRVKCLSIQMTLVIGSGLDLYKPQRVKLEGTFGALTARHHDVPHLTKDIHDYSMHPVYTDTHSRCSVCAVVCFYWSF